MPKRNLIIRSKHALLALVMVTTSFVSDAQEKAHENDFFKATFPPGTIFHQNVPYADDGSQKHLLDIYLPPQAPNPTPVIIWIHGGAWQSSDKYGDMNYMKNLIKALINNGYALVSIDYRNSTTAKFPAQIRDCNRAVDFVYKHAGTYSIDKNKIALMGFSAGGHLASLLGLSTNSVIPDFYVNKEKPSFSIKAVVDFYGPSNFIMFYNTGAVDPTKDPASLLLGASPLKRPDLAQLASPVTYVDKDDPPFFIVHGEKDDMVSVNQSIVLASYLDLAHVKNEFTIVKGAPHFGDAFDNAELRAKLLAFLADTLK